MSISDILTSDLISRVTAVSLTDILLTIGISFAVGLLIYYVYRKTFAGVLYSASFGVSLVSMCMISAMLILAVSSNVVLSLGTVGALSIVRFRTAIKEPMDIAFLFWAIAAGIITAAGMIPLAVLGSIAISAMLLFVWNAQRETPYLLIIHMQDSGCEQAVNEILARNVKKSLLKGKTVQKTGRTELTVEILPVGHESDFIREINALNGVEDVVMVSYNGDYTG